MSTLKTSNIQDTSGSNNSTPEEINQGRAKAWVNFNGEGSISIRDNFNVSSITDNATGEYTLNFTNARCQMQIIALQDRLAGQTLLRPRYKLLSCQTVRL